VRSGRITEEKVDMNPTTPTDNASTRDAQPAAPTPRDPPANAVRHGLSGKYCLPPALQPGRVDQIYHRLVRERAPHSFVEELNLRELARHAAILDVIEQGEPAVLRLAANDLAGLLAGAGSVTGDMALATAVTAEPLERVSRYRRAHEKGLYAALNLSNTLRDTPATNRRPTPTGVPNNCDTTAACEAVLSHRFEHPSWRCPTCSKRRGTYSNRLRSWKCAACGKRTGLRAGTIFARSAIPLPIWFRAIRIVAGNMQVTPRELTDLIGIDRPATVRQMLDRIRTALARYSHGPSPNADALDGIVLLGRSDNE
jgi:transposase-like protein